MIGKKYFTNFERPEYVFILLTLFVCQFSLGLSVISVQRIPAGFPARKEYDSGSIGSSYKLEDYTGYIPEKWRVIPQEPRAPEIDIALLKGSVNLNENLGLSVEYIISPKNTESGNDAPMIRRLKPDHETNANDGESGVMDDQDQQDRILMPDRILPAIKWRNIITVPSYCPKGQRRGRDGYCKNVISIPS